MLAAKGALRRLAIRGSLFEMSGYGLSQVLRLGGNIIMSRLLFPRAFGLVALVNIFNYGLVMLSDVGIEPAVIQSSRGDEPVFLNTAWTIQVIRGGLLYAVAILAAWPLAVLYKEPQLLWLTIIGSASVAITGLHSTSVYTLRRRLTLGTLTLIELGAQFAGLVVMILWAYMSRTVWPLVGGMIVSALVKMVATHTIKIGYRNRFAWDPESRAAITHFGKWIFGSSATTFASRQGDRLFLGRMLGAAQLGIYSIAVFISEAASSLVTRITYGVLFPILSRVHEQGNTRLRETYYKARLGLDAISMPALGALTMLGPWVIRLLYDKRYLEAGWMLQAFAIRIAMNCLLIPCETCLFASGQTRWGFFQNVTRLGWMFITLPLGWHFAGLRGIVCATAISEVPIFFVLWPPFHRAGILRLNLELRGISFYIIGLVPAWLLAKFFHA